MVTDKQKGGVACPQWTSLKMAVLLVLVVLWQLVGYTDAQCPTGCSCLRANTRLRCSGAAFTEVPTFPDSIKQTATSLYVRSCRYQEAWWWCLYVDVCRELNNNLITAIRATDFQGFVALETLLVSIIVAIAHYQCDFKKCRELQSNQIATIEEGSFSSNSALETLWVACGSSKFSHVHNIIIMWQWFVVKHAEGDTRWFVCFNHSLLPVC